jgi:nitrate reductase gamma subunit
MNSLLWMIAPYVALTSFVLGHIWRYRADQFGWTTRSSQIYESRLLRMGSPLFHFGLLGVFGGYVVGLMIPESWTAAVGISEWVYHLMAVTMGSLAGFAVVTGLGILLYRRIIVLAVAKATTRSDKLMAMRR